MERVACVYTITNTVNGKIYVGYTVDFYMRRYQHFSELRRGKHGNERLQNSVNKYGLESFIMEILWECEINELPTQEHLWCTLLNVHNSTFGYNIQPTSPNGAPRLMSPESKKKSSDSQKGRKLTEEHKAKLKVARKKQIFSEESKRKRALAITGKKRSKEHCERQSKISKNMELYKYAIQGRYIPIVRLSENFKVLAFWESIKQAADALGINNKKIHAGLQQKTHVTGYKWVYRYDYDEYHCSSQAKGY